MITLRKITVQDQEYFLELNNDTDTRYWMYSDAGYHKDDFYAILASKNVQWFNIIYTDLEKQVTYPVGLFTAYAMEDKLYVGIIIDKKYRGNGFGREALEHYLKVCDSLGIDTYLSCFRDNFAYKLYRKLGYKLTGKSEIVRDRKHVWMKREANKS